MYAALFAQLAARAQQNGQIRNQGGQAGLLGGPGAIDGSGQSFWNSADPFDLTGNASSSHFLDNFLDPGNVLGLNQAANPLNGAAPTPVGPMTGGNAGLMSAYSNFLRNLGAPPMRGGSGLPQQRPAPMGGPAPGGPGVPRGAPTPGGAGSGYPGLMALSQMNFGQPTMPVQPNRMGG